jgi:hypothetical protein
VKKIVPYVLHVKFVSKYVLYKFTKTYLSALFFCENILISPLTTDGHNEAEFGMSWCAGFSGGFYESYFQVHVCFCSLFDWSTCTSTFAHQE